MPKKIRQWARGQAGLGNHTYGMDRRDKQFAGKCEVLLNSDFQIELSPRSEFVVTYYHGQNIPISV